MMEIQNLSKEFHMHIRGGKTILSLMDVSFEVKKGEFLGLTGPSGIGKSSLLKCIYRTYVPTSGDIWYTDSMGDRVNLVTANEHEILRLRKYEIGYISQFLHVIPRVSAMDVITGALVEKGFDRKESEERAKEYLSRVGIPTSLWEMFPSTFSGGEKQRLNIIHAIISKPRMLLLDEPTASLDPNTKNEVVSLILELKKEGTAMIGVFHDHDTMIRLADKQYDLKLEKTKELCV
ncbi:MAG: phosphonate C-P lyase system protein PhnL [Clostridia bacterium]|nr:phosphonate C-P lyase system protein PhnL [Clostridia bacterium]